MEPMPDTNDTIQDDNDLRDTVGTLLAGLPPAVRDFVTSDKLDEVVLELAGKYQMHADQSGKFHEALVYMLLGVYDPERFVARLTQAGIPGESVQGVIADLNDRVFVPLRATEADAPTTTPAAPAPVAPQPAPVRPTPAPAPAAPQIPEAPVFHDPFAVLTQSAGPQQAIAPEAPAPVPAEPTMRTMAHDVEAMKTGTAPAPVPYAAPSVPPPAPAPAPESFIAPAPVDPLPSVRTFPPAQAPAEKSPDPKELHETLKKYGIDPYRESVD